MTSERQDNTQVAPSKVVDQLDQSQPKPSPIASTLAEHSSRGEEPEVPVQPDRSSEEILTPRTNLYASDAGWTLIAALPNALQSKTVLETEGAKLKLSAPHELKGIYQREFRFAKDTVWGELTARWEGDLLYINLQRAAPTKRAITIA